MTEEQAEQAVQELLDHPPPRDHNQALASLARSAEPHRGRTTHGVSGTGPRMDPAEEGALWH
jgi:hypothetical protein